MHYLKVNKAAYLNAKTIASVSYYHQVGLDAKTNAVFFDGVFAPSETNLVGSFVRPQSEHSLIYAIRYFTGDIGSGDLFESTWDEGNGKINSIQNATFTITNNGVVVLKNYPMTDFLPGLTTKDVGYIMLDEPILWEGQTSLTVQLTSADPSQVFGADIGGRFELVGIGLIA